MAYIPTIHTFEDDVNENIGVETPPAEVSAEPIVRKDSILVPEKPKSSFLKGFLIFISVILIMGAILVVGYYYYTNYQNKQAEAALNAQALAKVEAEKARAEASIVSNLKTIFPSLADGMGQHISSAVKKGNIIVITIKPNDASGVDNYSLLYAYILAHQKDLGKDLVDTFNLNNLTESAPNTSDISTASSSEIASSTSKNKSSSSTLAAAVNFFDPKSLQNNFNTLVTNATTPTPVSGDNLIWESKTLNNQDFEIANAGVVTLIYGYVKQNYLVFSLSLKDFFDTIKGLQ